ncbi:MAG: hypothetical protein P4L10_17720 [Acidobacteriaceae bacterium]|nr:hypothetical protein [Acidobacteriaceae bacterium]
MSTPITHSNKMGPKHSLRLRATKGLISAYVNLLAEGGRECVEEFLALQVYGEAGMGYYTPAPKRRRVSSAEEPFMCEWVLTVHNAWSKWAKIIKKANLREFERREAVREMLGALIQQKNKSSLENSELHQAAEQALEWTRWDENNRKMSLLRSSLENKSCIEAIASCEDREEAFKLLDATIRNYIPSEFGSATTPEEPS